MAIVNCVPRFFFCLTEFRIYAEVHTPPTAHCADCFGSNDYALATGGGYSTDCIIRCAGNTSETCGKQSDLERSQLTQLICLNLRATLGNIVNGKLL